MPTINGTVTAPQPFVTFSKPGNKSGISVQQGTTQVIDFTPAYKNNGNVAGDLTVSVAASNGVTVDSMILGGATGTTSATQANIAPGSQVYLQVTFTAPTLTVGDEDVVFDIDITESWVLSA